MLWLTYCSQEIFACLSNCQIASMMQKKWVWFERNMGVVEKFRVRLACGYLYSPPCLCGINIHDYRGCVPLWAWL